MLRPDFSHQPFNGFPFFDADWLMVYENIGPKLPALEPDPGIEIFAGIVGYIIPPADYVRDLLIDDTGLPLIRRNDTMREDIIRWRQRRMTAILLPIKDAVALQFAAPIR